MYLVAAAIIAKVEAIMVKNRIALTNPFSGFLRKKTIDRRPQKNEIPSNILAKIILAPPAT